MGVYLDFNSSAPIDERVLEIMVEVYKNSYGNADSRTHDYGENARKIVERARENVASLLKVKKDEIIFTSGATESNNIAFQGLIDFANKSDKKHIITTTMEHKSILESAKKLQELGFEVDWIKPEINGRVTLQSIKKYVKESTLLVSIMHVNNETGIIQPVDEIGDYLAEKQILFHIDATQSLGKLVDELRSIKYNMLSVSAHKIAGPQGIGALVLKKRRYKSPPIKAITFGGMQERGIRPGTIPVALVAGFGKACEVAEKEYKNNHFEQLEIRENILLLLEEMNVNYKINGEINYAISNTLNISFTGVSAEALMLLSKQYCGISNGSACNSSSYKLSYVLKSMGLSDDIVESSIRISWGSFIEKKEIYSNVKLLLEVVKSISI